MGLTRRTFSSGAAIRISGTPGWIGAGQLTVKPPAGHPCAMFHYLQTFKRKITNDDM